MVNYKTPACLKLAYVTAKPIPRTPNAKNPGTNLSTVAPQDDISVKFAVAAVAVLISVAIGPIRLTPTKIDTNPPIKFAIIVLYYYKTPACLSEAYVTARPIPSTPRAKNPGTSRRTVAPQDVALLSADPVDVTFATSFDIGPIRLTPTSIETKPPIRFAIIVCVVYIKFKTSDKISMKQGYINLCIKLFFRIY